MSKIKNHEDLVRDPVTGVVKNKNKSAFLNARARKKEILERKQIEHEKDCRICDLEKELQDLKQLVSQLISTPTETKPKRSKKTIVSDEQKEV